MIQLATLNLAFTFTSAFSHCHVASKCRIANESRTFQEFEGLSSSPLHLHPRRCLRIQLIHASRTGALDAKEMKPMLEAMPRKPSQSARNSPISVMNLSIVLVVFNQPSSHRCHQCTLLQTRTPPRPLLDFQPRLPLHPWASSRSRRGNTTEAAPVFCIRCP